ncbi:uncharacterized protein N7496_006891 [Penicillium cataractarum]|uniref:Peptidase M20 domain-containing protein 2 n=1 Tax=Penicillium cataractarum TaxID=2100454 RepID=A0A9W9S4D1_9EURO|nr:uncharacterized protein N7496_006891 [Penicillium cataractarum]KAJ5370799.1 hypothetical protein N7496_006891 [Penicillium cataractarum]
MQKADNGIHKEYLQLIDSVQESFLRHDDKLKRINQEIWSNPELGFEEHKAQIPSCAFFEALGSEGYTVRRKCFGLDTSFEVEYSKGTGGVVVAFNAEYDALPGIGHACGHNLIATSSIAAFIAAVESMNKLYSAGLSDAFTLRLLGTPAEENGGGKTHMIAAGAYEDVDTCLMVHPAGSMGPLEAMGLHGIAAPPVGAFLANQKIEVTFTGKPAHASAFPWEGVNALDAAVAAYVNISILQQQIHPTQRIHGIISHGGDRPNIIPARTVMNFDIRSTDKQGLEALEEKVQGCFKAAAQATGCDMEYTKYVYALFAPYVEDPRSWSIEYRKERYLDLKSNMVMCKKYVEAAKALGNAVWLGGESASPSGASTDQGNVSCVTPSFHGMFIIPTENGAQPHTPEFTKYTGTMEAYQSCLNAAAGMAIVACQLLANTALIAQVKEFSDMRQ